MKNTDQQTPLVISINISPGGIPKMPVESACVLLDGLKGDGHNHEKHRTPLQAVLLQDRELLDQLRWEGFPVSCGTMGENLTVRYFHVQNFAVGTVLEFSGGVILELTKVRKPCYVLDSIDPHLKDVCPGRCGLYAKVVREGILRVGETIRVKGAVPE